jgi:BASS family bile acid:Na+ symporter
MRESTQPITALSHLMHRHFLWLLLGAYAAAALAPGPGLWLKNLSLPEFSFFGERGRITLSMLLLALLLFNAGLGADVSRPRDLLRSLPLLAVGLAANLLVPLAFVGLAAAGLRLWHDPDEAQSLLVGLALVAAMPVAGSSTAWSQNNNGDVRLSLALVLLSTLISPLTTPLALRAASLTAGTHAAELRNLAAGGAGAFLLVCVALPSLLGIGVRHLVGPARTDSARPHLKLVNSVALLLLNYGNGAAALPQAVAYPDWDFLALILASAFALCLIGFWSGWGLGGLLGADRPGRTALTFALGMSNNGSGLVLAGVALAGHPRAMLPLIVYNLVQHLVAGGAAMLLDRGAGRDARAAREAAHPGTSPALKREATA